jgi:hypothetical protein
MVAGHDQVRSHVPRVAPGGCAVEGRESRVHATRHAPEPSVAVATRPWGDGRARLSEPGLTRVRVPVRAGIASVFSATPLLTDSARRGKEHTVHVVSRSTTEDPCVSARSRFVVLQDLKWHSSRQEASLYRPSPSLGGGESHSHYGRDWWWGTHGRLRFSAWQLVGFSAAVET